jgi:antitoxin (DNA-binding transcriptional repressor) of toxin-antitoxin stability system
MRQRTSAIAILASVVLGSYVGICQANRPIARKPAVVTATRSVTRGLNGTLEGNVIRVVMPEDCDPSFSARGRGSNYLECKKADGTLEVYEIEYGSGRYHLEKAYVFKK